METDQDNLTLVERVRTFDQDIQKFEANIKYIKEQIQAQVEQLNEYHEVEQKKEELKTAKEALRQACLNLSGYNDMLEQLSDEKDALKQARLNLSEFLLGYYHETGQMQIELEDKDPRDIILKGKLRKAKDGQLNMFAEGGTE